ncbi:LysR family transcriptional regulator [Litoreibacter roseus]|uniref:LysR family transcriptional regulator n=1 Tax=Litoreibacter roseus TaxID=2601869 RepID=A0A6N6JHE6_9RHOB|nr:LysR family transcriptional regulator [Litoreibacter roseus]
MLVHRGTPCTPTEIGHRLVAHADQIAVLEKGLTEDLNVARPSDALVRIAVSADSLATWIPPALAGQSGVLFDVLIDDQDHADELLRKSAVSAALTSKGARVQGSDIHALGNLRYIATASPGFVAKHFPDGPTAEAFRLAPAMTFNQKDALQKQWVQKITGKKIDLPTHYMASTHAFIDAALLGIGWGMNPAALVGAHIKSGRLVAIDETVPLDVPLYWQISRIAAKPLAGLTRAIKREAKMQLIQTGTLSGGTRD